MASLLCVLKRLAATDFEWRRIADLAATFVKPCFDLCNLFVVFFLVAARIQCGRKQCETGVLWKTVAVVAIKISHRQRAAIASSLGSELIQNVLALTMHLLTKFALHCMLYYPQHGFQIVSDYLLWKGVTVLLIFFHMHFK